MGVCNSFHFYLTYKQYKWWTEVKWFRNGITERYCSCSIKLFVTKCCFCTKTDPHQLSRFYDLKKKGSYLPGVMLSHRLRSAPSQKSDKPRRIVILHTVPLPAPPTCKTLPEKGIEPGTIRAASHHSSSLLRFAACVCVSVCTLAVQAPPPPHLLSPPSSALSSVQHHRWERTHWPEWLCNRWMRTRLLIFLTPSATSSKDWIIAYRNLTFKKSNLVTGSNLY